MSHGDRVEQLPSGFISLAQTPDAPLAAIAHPARNIFGLQFHPEVTHSERGGQVIDHFASRICEEPASWTPSEIIMQMTHKIREQVGDERALVGVSGGVDSSVAAALVHRAIGDQLEAVFVDNGLLRHDERASVERAFSGQLKARLTVVDARDEFLSDLAGVTDPELKRKLIGARFIRTFEAAAAQVGQPPFLVQGTIYPDVIESSGGSKSARKIKAHHNVGGLPDDMKFKLVEPLRMLFKDEVRAVGEALGLPHELVWRQPFPGPGLAVRCLGEVNRERLIVLRQADYIFTELLREAGLLEQRVDTQSGIVTQVGSAQAFAVLLPVRSVGVMGDGRTYEEVIALRAVQTSDFMTAQWAELPYALLAEASRRIVNEVSGVNRVVYDITTKPPGTIEWE
jgi:GMP synthase (glutamine-hydrolysing)